MKTIGKIYTIKESIYGAIPVRRNPKLIDNSFEFAGDFVGITLKRGDKYKLVAQRARVVHPQNIVTDSMNKSPYGYFILELPTGLFAVRAENMGLN